MVLKPSYEESIQYIASLEGRGWRLGLDRMREFCNLIGLHTALGNESAPQFIHIAGTNGKGSTAAFVQSILTTAGFRVGGYFSPFVFDIRERIMLDDRMISRDEFTRLVTSLRHLADEFDGSEFDSITEFEFKTAMGLLCFRDNACDWVSFEVGLGGRLDATNVITPACSVITSIGYDHTKLLGETLTEIATEKAGIVKHGVPVVVGEVPGEARSVIDATSKAFGSDAWFFGESWQIAGKSVSTPNRKVELDEIGVPGAFSILNAGCAIAAIDAAGISVSDDEISRGIGKARLPGRCQTINHIGSEFVLDGAHNRESSEALSLWIKSKYPNRRVTLIFGMLEGHDPQKFLEPLAGLVSTVICTSIDFFRTMAPDRLASQAKSLMQEVFVRESNKDAVLFACERASAQEIVLVSGSFYLVGSIGRLINAHKQFES